MRMTNECKKDVFKISVESPGAPAYYVYDAQIAADLKKKLDVEYGHEFIVTLKQCNIEPSLGLK
jgi:hypothetical protein